MGVLGVVERSLIKIKEKFHQEYVAAAAAAPVSVSLHSRYIFFFFKHARTQTSKRA